MYIHTLILLLLAVPSYSEIKCVRQTECYCSDYYDYLEYYCEKSQNTIQVDKQTKIVQVDCFSPSPLDQSDLPQIDVSERVSLDFFKCGPPKTNYLSILRKMNVKNISELSFDGIFDNQHVTIFSEDMFHGTEVIEALKIQNVKYLQIEENILEAVPKLREFTVHFSNITNTLNLNFSSVQNLTYLQMSSIGLQEIPLNEYNNLPQLKWVLLFNNNIKTLGTNAFKGAVNIQLLELSRNKIETIHENTFQNLNSLYVLSLFKNNISDITKDSFKHAKNLYIIRLEFNPMLRLHDYAFANMTNLTKISLNNCNIQKLPANLFKGSTNLQDVKLDNNQLSTIPNKFFDSLSKMKKLRLDHNNIQVLPIDIFEPLESLEELNLGHNYLTAINSKLFYKLDNLMKLNLRKNQIEYIERSFLNIKLEELDLSDNKLTTIEWNLNNLINLKYLNLSRNMLESETIPYNIHKVEDIDMSFNRIKNISLVTLSNVYANRFTVNLSNNEISKIDSTIYSHPDDDKQEITLFLDNNPIDCDCYNYNFITNYPNVRNVNKIFYIKNHEQLTCMSGIRVEALTKHLDTIKCPMNNLLTQKYTCTESCDCFWKPQNSTFEMDCSNRNLTQVPTFVAPLNCSIWNQVHRIKYIEINLSNNSLEVAPTSQDGYEGVTELNLSKNKIRNINWIPPNIQKLYLSHNRLTSMNDTILDKLNCSIKYLSLDGNRWTCDCSALKLQQFLIHNIKQVGGSHVYCKDSNVQIILNFELCNYTTLIVSTAAPIVVIILFIAFGLAMYYKWQEEIKVWLNSKNLCL
ncbi:protein toll-like [Aethina tumida]|uniref:protein toll-like n=1 Tax=Aethina tumida TaxID=116153 RepID=UPI0021490378|nr:protein toll-like [Aethina tumida]